MEEFKQFIKSKNLGRSQQFENNTHIHHHSALHPPVHIDNHIEELLLGSGRFYKKKKWANQIIETCIDTNFQSTLIQLHYGYYATIITLFHFQYQYNFAADQILVGSGQFGKVCTCRCEDKLIAVKLISFSQTNLCSSLKKIYREYFINLMGSSLKFGPKIIDIFGYQLVFFKNYALFGMQLGQKLNFQNLSGNYCSEISFQLLKRSLQIMHALHIVHRDIKPENIVWSPQNQKYVFIDFGLSEMIRQKAGQKTLTSFSGSYNYCSAEMKKYFLLKQCGKIDLYQNDLHGISVCKQFLNKALNKDILDFLKVSRSPNNFIEQFSCISRIKRVLFEKKYCQGYEQLIKLQNFEKTALITAQKILEQISNQQILSIWKQLKAQLRKNIAIKKFKTSQIDAIIFEALSKNSINGVWDHVLMSKKHLQNFQHWSDNKMWLQRIFLMLYPVKKSDQTKEQVQERFLENVDKIYGCLKLPKSDFIIQKYREVLLFFFQKFNKFENKKQMEQLNNYFVSMRDYTNSRVTKIKILEITQDPIEYCLKCLRYHLEQKISFPEILTDFQFFQKFHELTNNFDKKDNQILILLCQIVKGIELLESIHVNFHLLQQIQTQIYILKNMILVMRPEYQNLMTKICIQVNDAFITQISRLNYEQASVNQNEDFEIQQKTKVKIRMAMQKQYNQSLKKSICYDFFYKYLGLISPDDLMGLGIFFEISKKLKLTYNRYEKNRYYDEKNVQNKSQYGLTLKKQLCIRTVVFDAKNLEICKKQLKNAKKPSKLLNIILSINLRQLCKMADSYQIRIYDRFETRKLSFDEYLKLITPILNAVDKKISQIQAKEDEKYALHAFLRMNELTRTIFCEAENKQQIIIHLVQQICKVRKKLDQMNLDWKNILDNIGLDFIIVLQFIIKKSFVSSRQNIQFLKDMLLNKFNYKKQQQLMTLFVQSGFFENIMKIRLQRFSEEQNIAYIRTLIRFIQKIEFLDYVAVKNKQLFCNQLIKIVDLFSNQFLVKFISRLNQQEQNKKFTILIRNHFGGYLAFHILLKLRVSSQILDHIFLKYFYKIVSNSHRFCRYVTVNIQSLELLWNADKANLTPRKRIYYLRVVRRNSLQNNQFLLNGAKSILLRTLQKKIKMWPSRIYNKTKYKIFH